MACVAHTSCSPSTTPVHHKYIWARPASTKIFSSLFLQVFTLSDHAGSVPSVVVLSHSEERSSDSSVAVSFHETLTLRSLEHSSFRYVRMFTSTYVRFGHVTFSDTDPPLFVQFVWFFNLPSIVYFTFYYISSLPTDALCVVFCLPSFACSFYLSFCRPSVSSSSVFCSIS
ncbi:predicted protein [Clavispora lusitaniae ATCC 42720]|uniref:Uncharacterized protein n=1 Tax=Clavispora lusitaniae (strain ATCC 42720) TaxID=306902 RepID=C4XXH4_CLAL4|nr:uncharacterized protein CLUG_00647 [Clavispora lusitaniae ATCC 42720]EEQ36524.1 predicted protein [Clavispora lusitaniae ATCC 42720]